MAILEIDCPICGEVLELSDEDRTELEVGDAIVCENCNAEMEVTRNAEQEFEVELLGILTTCPNCAEEFDVTEEMLAAAPTLQNGSGEEVSLVRCPHCQAAVELSFEEQAEA
ncbi:hypothetical protein EHF33_03455 [Deinococcus psychrotolerans]|uniref:Zinc finger motif protein n=1 Tax=Deinococcus psychrotolerans TaxID=2489213 RepID=A0A3G8YK97_9DEIO|nr:hypothetical protein [Deinococcus psychrotolerans]AZI41921.1 hypothetical protein EHF33_03455 [Deinococcus psychrotolerans]